MYPTPLLRSDDIPLFKHNKYLNKATWGNLGSQPQKGILTYSLSPNVQRISVLLSASNGWRRFRNQVLYWAPPLVAAWYAMQWADERNRFLNSKDGRKLHADEEH